MKKNIKNIPHKDYHRLMAEKYRRQNGILSRAEILNHNFNTFIKEATKIHQNKYNYNKVEYRSSTEKIIITCPVHGDFLQQPYSHKTGQGCPECGKILRNGSLDKRAKKFIVKANAIHNNKYTYEALTYTNIINKVEIGCYEHGPFFQTGKAHLRGQGCPYCANIIRANFQKSKGEITIESYLTAKKINYEIQKTFSDCVATYPLRFDFYLPTQNTLIEYDGDQHYKYSKKFHGTIETFKLSRLRDSIKTNYAKSKNIKLLRIKFKKRNQQAYIENILDEFIVD